MKITDSMLGPRIVELRQASGVALFYEGSVHWLQRAVLGAVTALLYTSRVVEPATSASLRSASVDGHGSGRRPVTTRSLPDPPVNGSR